MLELKKKLCANLKQTTIFFIIIFIITVLIQIQARPPLPK